MNLSFPSIAALDAHTGTVSFPADIDGKRHRCAISWEALRDHFGAHGQDMVAAFEAARSTIENTAARAIRSGAQLPLLLKTADF